jgi:hypothetical protein
MNISIDARSKDPMVRWTESWKLLALLAGCADGITDAMVEAHGFPRVTASLLAADGFAALHPPGTVNARHFITEAGKKALFEHEAPYGRHLPLFPWFKQAPTEETLEREVERLVNVADAHFMAGRATQEQYDGWVRALDTWSAGIIRRKP